MKHTVISPHLDDAVLSLGQWLATTPATVVTVFAGSPNGGVSDYDKASGFHSSVEAMAERRAEDEKACRSLGARPVHLDFTDRQYRLERDRDRLVEQLAELFVPGMRVWAPLGLGHPDHRLVTRAAIAACPDMGEVIFYEEFPYRTLWPEQVHPALERVRDAGFHVEPYGVDQGPPMMKAAAIRCYRSQYPEGADGPELYVPERAWRATL